MKTIGRVSGCEKRVANCIAFLFLFAGLGQAKAQSETQVAPQPEEQREIVVSLVHRKLALIENGEVIKIYSVAVGTEITPSPVGDFTIRTRVVRPTYYHPGRVIPAGPENPLGTRWIGLSTKGYGIHGTNEERSIGKPASHGCIRMHRKDLEDLFARVRVGDRVQIVAAETQETAQIFDAAPASAPSAVPSVVVASNSGSEEPSTGEAQ
ncbi:MAG TPA: L,D-transpeptidase [Terriglobales bacterium]|nr:L,D-transpeptidase [Terriglobales bacterium]